MKGAGPMLAPVFSGGPGGSGGSMRVLVLGYQNRTGVAETIQQLRPLIEQKVEVVQEDLTGKADLSCTEADIALVFGGDGSILRAVQQMGTHQLPVLSVNLGRLGFLAGLSRNDSLPDVLEKLSLLKRDHGPSWLEMLRGRDQNISPICGEIQSAESHSKAGRQCKDERHGCGEQYDMFGFSISSHRLLNCLVTLDGPQTSDSQPGISSFVMNEVTIQSADFHIVEVDIWADGEFLTTCHCDGLILGTPIGSTAHNLSAGGPILRPGLDAVVLSPVAPHSMTFRPIVDSAQRTFCFRLTSGSGKAAVVVDGTRIAEITAKETVYVTPSKNSLQMIELPGSSYFLKLQKKLGWGGHFVNVENRISGIDNTFGKESE